MINAGNQMFVQGRPDFLLWLPGSMIVDVVTERLERAGGPKVRGKRMHLLLHSSA
jgi:hypothetical protein